MAFDDLREFIAKVQEAGECKIVEGADCETDIGTICELMAEKPNPPLLLFDKVEGYPSGYRVAAIPFGSERRTALAFGLPEEARGVELVRALKEKIKAGIKLIPPVEVKTGSVKQNIRRGKDVNLFDFPAPKWHELDGGRYIGTGDCVVTRDPDGGWLNLGTYRVQVHDKTTATIRIGRDRDGYLIARKFWAKGKPCPVAVSCGQDPLLFSAAGWRRVPWGVSEYDFAGGLRNKPVEVTKGVTNDLLIPAAAEIVLEGDLISPELEHLVEGPFGEWPAYYNGPFQDEPVFKVKAILHRDDPILQGNPPSRFPGVYTLGGHFQKAAVLWSELEKQMPGVRGVRVIEDATLNPMVVISLKQEYDGQAKQAALLACGSSSTGYCLKFVIVVDEDIDPFNTSEVLWAMGTRCEPVDSIDIIRGCLSLRGVAWESPEKKRLGISSQSVAIILACKPFHWMKQFPQSIRSSAERINKTKEKWGHLFS